MTTNRRKPRDSGKTRNALLDSAARLFREKGYASTSLKDLAVAVEISPSAMYWHFPSKNDLLYSVMKRTLTRFEKGLLAALAETDETPPARLSAFVRYYVKVQLSGSSDVDAYSSIYATDHMLDHLPDSNKEELRAIERRIFRGLCSIIQDGVDDRRFTVEFPSTAALAISGMCEQVQIWFRPNGKGTAADIAERYANLALSMVGYRPDPL